ncbi:MAG TPA: serine hydrolase [Chitinophagaceae bacterium]|nr:serine hydrolase [Chitinophagaceae bacterium]
MKRILLLLVLTTALAGTTQAQRATKKLKRQIAALIQGFHGEIGVYVKDLRHGSSLSIAGDSIFPTASMVKVPILIGIMEKIQRGELDYHQSLVYKDSLLYPGVDILGSFKSGEKIELSEVMMLMLTMSDNTASLWLQSLAGGGSVINGILDSLGFTVTRVNSRTPGREEARDRYGWGQTSPREMAALLEKIYRRQILGDSACIRMMRELGRDYWDEEAISAIPPTIAVFAKSGAVDASRSEVILVNVPRHPYVLCICTNHNQDQSWEYGNEAWVLTRKLSRLVWKHFAPHYD